MNLFEEILKALDKKMVEPQMYGWFHILFLIILISSILIVKLKYNNLSDKSIKRILLIYSIVCITFEIYKQLNFSFNYDDIKTWWSYSWYAFPFQFCSVPMYVALIAALTKNSKVTKSIYTFLATYGLIAGLSCMIYPSTVFVDTIGINIQTMVHHGSMVFIGALLLINNKVEYTLKSLLSSLFVFLICLSIALVIDITTYYVGIDGGLEMFFISPFHTSSLPVFSIIYEKVYHIKNY
jgi:hypothetical protein